MSWLRQSNVPIDSETPRHTNQPIPVNSALSTDPTGTMMLSFGPKPLSFGRGTVCLFRRIAFGTTSHRRLSCRHTAAAQSIRRALQHAACAPCLGFRRALRVGRASSLRSPRRHAIKPHCAPTATAIFLNQPATVVQALGHRIAEVKMKGRRRIRGRAPSAADGSAEGDEGHSRFDLVRAVAKLIEMHFCRQTIGCSQTVRLVHGPNRP